MCQNPLNCSCVCGYGCFALTLHWYCLVLVSQPCLDFAFTLLEPLLDLDLVLTLPWPCLNLSLNFPWPCLDLVWPCPNLAFTLPQACIDLASTLPWACFEPALTLPSKLGPNHVSNSCDIPDMDKCHLTGFLILGSYINATTKTTILFGQKNVLPNII